MQETIVPAEKMNSDRESNKLHFQKLNKRDVFLALVIGATFFAINSVWFSYDHHVPQMDEAGHILRNIDYKDLFEHPRPFNTRWYVKFLTVDGIYPPTVDTVSGFLKTFMGSHIWVDDFVMSSFTFLLSSSVFLAGRCLGLGMIASSIAAAFINLYPESSVLSHMYMADYPALVGVAFGLFLFCWWWQNPNIKSSIVSGLLLGACCLTKHIAMVFMLGIGLFFLAMTLMDKNPIPRKTVIKQLFVLVAGACAIVLPWLIANGSGFIAMTNSVYEYFDDSSSPTYLSNLVYYCQSFWYSLTPILCTFSILSLFLIGKRNHSLILPVWSSLIVGIFIASFFSIQTDRYMIPSLLLPAFVSGILAEKFLSANYFLKTIAVSVVLVACLQFLSFNFSPYPIAASGLDNLSRILGVHTRTLFFLGTDGINKDNPIPYQDWGYDWVYSTIENVDKDTALYLNVMINISEVNAQTFELSSRQRGSKILPTTSRRWGLGGDRFIFEEKKALYHNWYLFKTGDHGKFIDAKAIDNYHKLLDFVKNSGKFKFYGEKTLPDNSKLSIYRQII